VACGQFVQGTVKRRNVELVGDPDRHRDRGDGSWLGCLVDPAQEVLLQGTERDPFARRHFGRRRDAGHGLDPVRLRGEGGEIEGERSGYPDAELLARDSGEARGRKGIAADGE
jgi:hypothetical protein